MLKENKIVKENTLLKGIYGDKTIGYYEFEGYDSILSAIIPDDENKPHVNEEDYFFTEFSATESESDYHTFATEYNFNGVYLAFNLNRVDTVKYFGYDLSQELIDEPVLLQGVRTILEEHHMLSSLDKENIEIHPDGYLKVILPNKSLGKDVLLCAEEILKYIHNYYAENEVHITRMFGSYILLKRENGELKAIKATPIPIKYCPLMIQLLREVGKEVADDLIKSLQVQQEEMQTKAMCELINEVVIKGGYFDTNRPLNSCEANVLFGASETMSSAFKTGMIDAAVIVSNNLGTIITTNAWNTQGAVKRMTGLFHTSPNENLTKKAIQEKIIPVFPYTASINQLEGVKKAIALGYKKIAVSVAAYDNGLHEQLAQLEKEHNITIYKFGLCSTGIDKETALKMQEYADVVWSCASKYVKEYVEPNALAQVGVKIPVHVMTKQGWDIIKNHLLCMNNQNNLEDISLQNGEEKPILLHSEGKMKVLKKKHLHTCSDCPHPCV